MRFILSRLMQNATIIPHFRFRSVYLLCSQMIAFCEHIFLSSLAFFFCFKIYNMEYFVSVKYFRTVNLLINNFYYCFTRKLHDSVAFLLFYIAQCKTLNYFSSLFMHLFYCVFSLTQNTPNVKSLKICQLFSMLYMGLRCVRCLFDLCMINICTLVYINLL